MYKYLFFFAVISLCSCDEQLVSAEYHDVQPSGWSIEDVASFQIVPQDSIAAYNLFINLRNTHDYEYNNLWLISQIKFPHGKVVTDTLQYRMTESDGTFLGTGYSDVLE
ncbi:MAG: gliding motility-associated lipoprotein GldH, partial [Nonlabens sp.]